jgi:LPS-assembly lipoprotein
MLMKRRLACALAVTSGLMLSACGFRLRGTGTGAMLPFKTVYLAVPTPSSFGTELKRNIESIGSTTIVTDPKAAEAVFELLSEARTREILSLNSQGRVREFTLLSRMSFRVKDKSEKILLGPTEIVLRRILSFNENQVLAKESEEAALFREMQSDMVQQIMRRLAAIKPAA